jgi:hypothetical protein
MRQVFWASVIFAVHDQWSLIAFLALLAAAHLFNWLARNKRRH